MKRPEHNTSPGTGERIHWDTGKPSHWAYTWHVQVRQANEAQCEETDHVAGYVVRQFIYPKAVIDREPNIFNVAQLRHTKLRVTVTLNRHLCKINIEEKIYKCALKDE